MANTDTATIRTLSDAVAEEIRVLLTRRRMSQRQLAQALGVSPAWLNYRLTGTQAIDLNDLQRIADTLQVHVTELLPAAFRPNDRSAARSRSTWPTATAPNTGT